MRTVYWPIARISVGLVLFGCTSDSPPAPRDFNGGSAATGLAAKPVISSVDGTDRIDGLQVDPLHDPKHVYGQLEAEYYSSPAHRLTIKGTGFGDSKGQVILSDPNFIVGDPSCIEWSKDQITFCIQSKLDATPTNVGVSVVTAGSASQTSDARPVFLVPTIATRAYGQCTWWVSLETIVQFGDHAEPPIGHAYPDLGTAGVVAIDGNYVPRPYDGWLDAANGHQAFISSVSAPHTSYNSTTRRVTTTYDVTLTQYNVGNSEEYSTYPTTVTFDQSYDPISAKITGPRSLATPLVFSATGTLHPNRAWRHGSADPVQSAVFALTPLEGSTIAAGQTVSFTGGAYRGAAPANSSTLSWKSDRDGALGTGSPLAKVLTSGNHTITLTAIDGSGVIGSDVVHIAVSSPPPVSASLTASRDVITAGDAVLLTWSSNNAGSCTKNWSLDTSPSGNETVKPSATNTYRVDCLGLGGSASASVKVTVNAPAGATLNVQSNLATSWVIMGGPGTPINSSSQATFETYRLTPATSGDVYSINPAPAAPGYVLNVTTSDNPSCSNSCGMTGLTLHPSESKSFNLTYTPTASGRPQPPQNVAARVVAANEIDISWTPGSSDATSFKIERCTGPGCTGFTEIGSVTGSPYTNTTGLSAGTTYRYRVRAFNPLGYSDYSSIVQGIPADQIPTPIIAHVVPNPVTGSNSPQNFTVNGADFVSGAFVRLRDKDHDPSTTYYDKTPTSLTNINITISANFTTTPSHWTVEVINPGNKSSGEYAFTVKAP